MSRVCKHKGCDRAATYGDYCVLHADLSKKPKKKTKYIKKISDKRQQQLKLYELKRKQYLKRNPKCCVCGKPATDIHHTDGRTNERLNDFTKVVAICRTCHRRCHDSEEFKLKHNL